MVAQCLGMPGGSWRYDNSGVSRSGVCVAQVFVGVACTSIRWSMVIRSAPTCCPCAAIEATEPRIVPFSEPQTPCAAGNKNRHLRRASVLEYAAANNALVGLTAEPFPSV